MPGVDSLGRLTVGPKSAGAEPGPAAFGRGGTEATVTDADVTLGYIDPAAFAEGRLNIDSRAAAGALEASVGRSLGLCAGAAALGVSQIVDESMASAGRMHAVESGKDLGDRIMIAFGGNGPLHATRVARRAGVRQDPHSARPRRRLGNRLSSMPRSRSRLVRSRYTTLDANSTAPISTPCSIRNDRAEAEEPWSGPARRKARLKPPADCLHALSAVRDTRSR